MPCQHNFDDKHSEPVAEHLRLKAPGCLTAWKDINALVELFARLTEMQRFHLDGNEDASPFFPLLGIVPRRVAAARVEVVIAGGYEPGAIPAGTPLYAEDARFETEQDVNYDGNALTLGAVQRENIETPFFLGHKRGFPNTCFRVDTRGQTILSDTFALCVEDETWSLVDSLRASRPDDKHYTLNEETGEILFGDGINGAIPSGNVTVMTMVVTRGAGGNIAPNRITILNGFGVSQPEAAKGGAAKESIAEALARSRRERRQAATARDIEQIVLETPELSPEHVRVFMDDTVPKIGEPRVINISVKLKSGILDEDAKRRIIEHLEPYRLVCRDFRINNV